LAARPPWFIIGRTAKPTCLRGRLSSNVRRRQQGPRVLSPPSRGHGPRIQGPRIGQAFEGPRVSTDARSVATRLSQPAALSPSSQVKPLRGASNALPLGCFTGPRAISHAAPLRLKPGPSPCASEPPPKTPAPGTPLHMGPVAAKRLVRRQPSGGPSRAAPPNPSLKSRPATAAGLGRAAALVHHRPHGQARPPPRSA
jgi:hypothetical protein